MRNILVSTKDNIVEIEGDILLSELMDVVNKHLNCSLHDVIVRRALMSKNRPLNDDDFDLTVMPDIKVQRKAFKPKKK